MGVLGKACLTTACIACQVSCCDPPLKSGDLGPRLPRTPWGLEPIVSSIPSRWDVEAPFFVLGGCRASRLPLHGLSNVSPDLTVALGTGTLDVVLIRNPFIFSQQSWSGMECKGSCFLGGGHY